MALGHFSATRTYFFRHGLGNTTLDPLEAGYEVDPAVLTPLRDGLQFSQGIHVIKKDQSFKDLNVLRKKLPGIKSHDDNTHGSVFVMILSVS